MCSIRIVLLALLALAALGGYHVAHAAKSFVWQRIASDVQVRADGTLGVTEQMTLRYSGGPFTFVYRDLPDRRLDGISNISLSDAERAYRQVKDNESSEPYTFSVSREDGAQRVRWVYPPTSDGERTFTLRYDVAGAVRRGANADEVWWTMVFADREEPVIEGSGRISLPQPVPPAQLQAAAPDAPGEIALEPGVARVSAANLAPGQELTLRLAFPAGVVGGATPSWQAAEQAQQSYNATLRPTVNIALSALAAVLAALFALGLPRWWRGHRDPRPQLPPPGELGAPPDTLAPAVAARFVDASGGQALLATLVDLANRGYLTMHEEMAGWRNQRHELMVERTDKSLADLAPFEQETLDGLDLRAAGSRTTINQERTSLQKLLPSLNERYDTLLRMQGYISEEARRRRTGGLVAGVILLVAGGAGLVLGLILGNRWSWWLPVIPAVVAAGGLVWLIMAASIRGLTQEGAEARQRWEGFRRYLERLQAEHVPAGQFPGLLAWAVALADAGKLARAYGQTAEPLPIWYFPAIYHGAHGGHGGHMPSASAGVGATLMLQDFGQNFVTAINGAASTASSTGGGGGGGGASGGGGGGAG